MNTKPFGFLDNYPFILIQQPATRQAMTRLSFFPPFFALYVAPSEFLFLHYPLHSYLISMLVNMHTYKSHPILIR